MATTNLSTLLGSTPTTHPWTNASASFTAVAKNSYQLVLSSSITVTLPASPNNGDYVRLLDYSQNSATYNVIINNNGHTIQGISDTLTMNINGISLELTYITGQGWIITDTGNITAAPTAYGFRNLIINGDMKIAQRGTSGALTSSAAYLSVDRWATLQTGTANGVLTQVSTGTPTGFQYAVKLGRNSGATTTGNLVIQQALETVNCIPLQGQSVTLSFYAKAGANYSGGAFIAQLVTGTGTDQTASTIGSWTGNVYVVDTGVTLTTSWTRYIITGSISSTATQIGVALFWSPSGTAGADDNAYITGVQLEPGSSATPFEIRPFQSELALCQRYYQTSYDIGTAPGTNITSTGLGLIYSGEVNPTTGTYVPGTVTLKTTMRADATARYWDAAGNLSKYSSYTGGGLARTDNVGVLYSIVPSMNSLIFTVLPGTGNFAAFAYDLSAEL